jgi:hypothetical protein
VDNISNMIAYDCIIQSRHAWIRRYHVGGDEAQHVGVAQHEMQQNQTYDVNAYTPERLASALFNSRESFAVQCLLFPRSHTLMTIYSCRPRTSFDS